MEHDIALEVRGLTRRYPKLVAVDQLDLTVRRGDIYGFLGPNGAGKTTAMRCILGLIRRDAGQVAVFGETRPHLARRHLGAIIETPAFHGWLSGRDNLLLAGAYRGLSRAEARREADRVLERVGLVERAGDRAHTYSLGMKQRLGIARALLGGPRLLLLDEPTNGLDPRGMHEVREFIRNLALTDGITVFLSSHLLSEVQALCTRVGILQGGRLRAEGEVADLIGAQGEGVVDLSSPDLDALRAQVAEVPGVRLLDGTPRGLRVDATSLGVPELVRALAQRGADLTAVVPVTRSLEDVFLEVTR